MIAGYVKYKYPFIKPEFPSAQEMVEDYIEIINSNWFTNFGPFEKKFSKLVGEYIGGVSATTVANCTLGLDLAIATLFDKTKKRILVQSFTFAAGPEMLIKNDFIPLFLDINKSDWQANITQAERAIADYDDIGGILLCNTFGVGNSDVSKWERLALKNGLALIIDTAAGFGSEYQDGEIVGGRGDCEVFSLHATKPFAVGEGGLITSKNSQLIEKLRLLQNFGFHSDRIVHEIGTNAKMQEINCAIGVRQIARLQERISERQRKLGVYRENLEMLGFEFQTNDQKSTIAFVSTLVPEGCDANIIQQSLVDVSVEARRYYTPALHLHPKIMEFSEIYSSLDNSDEVSNRILSLPLLYDMEDSDIIEICKKIEGFIKAAR